jgi:hypothetical protein
MWMNDAVAIHAHSAQVPQRLKSKKIFRVLDVVNLLGGVDSATFTHAVRSLENRLSFTLPNSARQVTFVYTPPLRVHGRKRLLSTFAHVQFMRLSLMFNFFL